jgi:glutamate-1-semialdehyde 2,1-aminomutase
MTAGIETLKVLSQPGVYERLEGAASRLEEGIVDASSSTSHRLTISRFTSLLTIFFTDGPLPDYEAVSQADTALFGKFFERLISAGIYWPPSQFEAAFVSLAHSENDIDATIHAVRQALSSLPRA